MFVLTNPFFWAFLGMFGLLVGTVMLSGIKLGQNALFGFGIIIICDSSRIILTLPFCIQPRFEMGLWNWIIGGIVLAVAMAFGIPALSINWRTAPNSKTVLKTNGIYSVVRNPIYLCDLLFSLGFAIMFGSIVGLALDSDMVDRFSIRRSCRGSKPGTHTGTAILGIQATGKGSHHSGIAYLISRPPTPPQRARDRHLTALPLRGTPPITRDRQVGGGKRRHNHPLFQLLHLPPHQSLIR